MSKGFGQQEGTSPKGFAEIHGDRPRPLRFRGVKLAPTYAGCPFSKKTITITNKSTKR